jgi:hypothetical protein
MDLDYEFVSYPTRTLDLATYIRGQEVSAERHVEI